MKDLNLSTFSALKFHSLSKIIVKEDDTVSTVL